MGFLDSFVDVLTFDVFDLDKSRKRPAVNIKVPGGDNTGKEIIRFTGSAVRKNKWLPPQPTSRNS